MNWSLATKSLLSPTLASRSGDPSPPPRRRRTTVSPSSPPPRRRRKQPSVAEVQRAIGVVDDDPMRGMRPDSSSGSRRPPPPSMLDLMSLTPIGQAEGPVERKIRELAEWVVDQTEANAKAGQQILLVVCLKILPVWLLLLLVASGIIKLPFDVPFLDDLFS